MNVLVLGGTGAMGSHLVKLLADSNVHVTVTTRSCLISSDNIKYLKGNAHDKEFLNSLLDVKWDSIIDFLVYKTESFKARYQILLNSTSHYIFLSSARVYANSSDPITEEYPRLLDVSDDLDFLSTDEYPLAKARQEDILSKSGYKNWTIIRPYITYNENRLQLGVLEKEDWLYRALMGRTIVFSNDMMEKMTTMTYAFDVSKRIMSIIGKSSAMSQVFNIVSENPTSWQEVLAIYLSAIEKYSKKTPRFQLLNIQDFLECHPGKFSVIYDRLYNRQFISIKISTFCEVKSFKTVDVGLKESLDVFLQNPVFNKINWKNEALKDRATGERASISEINGNLNKLKYIIIRDFYSFYVLLKMSKKWKYYILMKKMHL